MNRLFCFLLLSPLAAISLLRGQDQYGFNRPPCPTPEEFPAYQQALAQAQQAASSASATQEIPAPEAAPMSTPTEEAPAVQSTASQAPASVQTVTEAPATPTEGAPEAPLAGAPKEAPAAPAVPLSVASASSLPQTTEAAALPAAARWQITCEQPVFFGKNQFDRIGEYFTGKEEQWPTIYIRSNPQERRGFYWEVHFNRPLKELPEGAIARFEVLWTAKSVKIKTTEILLTRLENATQTSLFLGLTGKSCRGPNIHPNAWRLTLLIPGEAPISVQSYLWSFQEEARSPVSNNPQSAQTNASSS